MKKYLPILDWLPNYKKKDLAGDLSAGLTVGVMLVPQGMAYAMLADLPAIYGLYASTIPLILYAIFGTSRQLAVGPVAMVSLLIASGVGAIAATSTLDFVQLAILLALMVGVLQFSMGIFKLGFLVNFLSHPVIAGFTSAAALIIGFSQLKHLLGISIPRGKVHETIINVFHHFSEINWSTFAIGLGGIVTIIILRKINKKIPSPLVVVLLGLGAVILLGLEQKGVKIVGEVPAGLPSLTVPAMNMAAIKDLIPIALTIALVGFMESIAVAKSIQKKHKDYEVVPNQELIGLGIANIGGSFFQAFPTTGGFSRTAVNDQAGAKTGLAAIISAVLILLTLLFLTEYFYFLPKAILAAIIMVAVFGLIDFKEAKHLWKTDKKDFSMFVITAVATLSLGVEEGIAVGVVVSLLALIVRSSYPHIAELGVEPTTKALLNIKRFENNIVEDHILIIRPDAQLFFANINYFLTKLKEMEGAKPNLEVVILKASGINSMDSSAVHAVHDLLHDYNQRNIRFVMTDVKGPVRDILYKSHLMEEIGEKNFFVSVENALQSIKKGTGSSNSSVILQANE